MKAAGPAKEINARPEAEAFSIVGGGASARGLKAFIELTGALGEKTGMAFVLVQHLDPKHPSILPELIAKAARIPVLEVKDGVKVEPDHIYVIPPNTSMEVSRGVLSLLPRKSGRSGYLPIDHFFHSLAEDAGTRAIGVILSGTASDGAAGLNHIKASGGITFAQSPESAEYDGMPRSAIAAGAADSVLPPAEIAAELARIASHPNFAVPPVAGSELTRESEGSFLRRVLFILRQARGVNFAEYKSTTLWRRIHRRMVINRSETPNDYLRLLQASPAEAEALYQDFLITVTRFFRDPGAFEALRQLAFPEIMKKKLSEAPVRLWVPGCSTGEEAYSLAISVLEFLETSGRSHPVQIFATDINDRALETARAGVYAEGLARDVSAERLRRYFTRTDGGWQVIKSLRELCIFARQDVTRDPPFSRMDLISFRNVLIYLGTSMQKKLLPVMHYALLPGGYLLLGSSESVDGF